MEKKMSTQPETLCKGYPGKGIILYIYIYWNSGAGYLFEIC